MYAFLYSFCTFVHLCTSCTLYNVQLLISFIASEFAILSQKRLMDVLKRKIALEISLIGQDSRGLKDASFSEVIRLIFTCSCSRLSKPSHMIILQSPVQTPKLQKYEFKRFLRCYCCSSYCFCRCCCHLLLLFLAVENSSIGADRPCHSLTHSNFTAIQEACDLWKCWGDMTWPKKDVAWLVNLCEIHYNHCDLTIYSDTGYHSQFFWCLCC